MAKGKIDSPANGGGKQVFSDRTIGAGSVKAVQSGFVRPVGSTKGTGVGRPKS